MLDVWSLHEGPSGVNDACSSSNELGVLESPHLESQWFHFPEVIDLNNDNQT